MASVTKVVAKVKSPGNNFIKASDFTRKQLKSTETLRPMGEENVAAAVVGLAVDYLTRFMLSGNLEESFSISFKGAFMCSMLKGSDDDPLGVFADLLTRVNGLDDESIQCACKLATFDVWHRSPLIALDSKGHDETNPNAVTIENIRIMVKRSLSFFEKYGPITKMGFDFHPNGYTETVTAGDGDYLTKDTLWDFKVSKAHPTCINALQILTYWVMGQHSGQDIFKDISQIGIFNPRLNIVYIYKISWLDEYIIRDVEDEIIGY